MELDLHIGPDILLLIPQALINTFHCQKLGSNDSCLIMYSTGLNQESYGQLSKMDSSYTRTLFRSIWAVPKE